jgi:hypothetical protein
MEHISFYTGLEKEICDEIKNWSQHALENPNEKYGGLPVCAYAKKSWQEKRVGFSFKYCSSYQPLSTILSTFDNTCDVVILVDLEYEKDSEKFHEFLLGINGAISEGFFIQKDLWVMGFHPNDEVNENIDDGTFEPIIDTEYAMIFIQKLTKLQESAEKLKKTGYYKHYFGDDETPHVFQLRSDFYEKLRQEI